MTKLHSLLEKSYNDAIKSYAENIVSLYQDEEGVFDYDESGCAQCYAKPIIRKVKSYIYDLCDCDLFNLIVISPFFRKKPEKERGIFLDHNNLKHMLNGDSDEIRNQLDILQEYFLDVHEDSIKQIIFDIEWIVPDVLEEVFDDMGRSFQEYYHGTDGLEMA